MLCVCFPPENAKKEHSPVISNDLTIYDTFFSSIFQDAEQKFTECLHNFRHKSGKQADFSVLE